MRLNTKPTPTEFTHEGAPAARMSPMQALRRSVMSCLLWEQAFYEDGEEISERIARLAGQVPVSDLAALAVEARHTARLRHVPLLLLSVLAERGTGRAVADAIEATLSRADEPAEFLAVHMARHKAPRDKLDQIISAQMKKGIAAALGKWDEYQLAKYDRDGAIKLRDVIRLVHPKPKDEAQAALWKRVLDRGLVTPDTWEVALSGGADKRETFTRLLQENKLGYLALLRNLRNMADAGVDTGLMRDAIIARKGAGNVLPFRYVAAARACPQMEPALDQALSEAVLGMPILPCKTAVLVDVSGSMDDRLSARSDMTRMIAAAALAGVINGDRRVFSFSNAVVEVPPRSGMACVDAVIRSQRHQGTYLGAAVDVLNREVPHDRLIVVTDEQSHDRVPDPKARHAYMINVASNRNGVGYERWTRIHGFSENVLRFIHEHERNDA